MTGAGAKEPPAAPRKRKKRARPVSLAVPAKPKRKKTKE